MSSSTKKRKGQRFPHKLFEMLEGAEESSYSSIVSWNTDGRSFTIHDSEALMQQVVPLYFQQTHFRSFERQLNLWGFERCGRQGWCHEYFVRGNGEELHLIQIKVRPRPQQDPIATSSYPSGQVPFQSSQSDGGFGDIFGHQQPSQPMNNTEAATGKAYGGKSSLSGFEPPTARSSPCRGSSSNATPNIQPDDDNEDDPLLLMSKTIYVDDSVACNCSFCLAYKIVSGDFW